MSALDSQSRMAIGEDLYKIIKNEGKTAIMVTHDLNEAISLSDRVIVLSKRPAKIKNIYEISFGKDLSPVEKRSQSEFFKYYELIWRDLDVHI